MSENGKEQSHRFLLRTISWPRLAALIAPSAARHRGASADVGKPIGRVRVTGRPAAEHRFRDGVDGTTASHGEIIGRTDPRRTLLLGGVAVFVVTIVVGVVALRDGTSQEPIRGEFVAGIPDGPADDPANGDVPPGGNGTGSDAQGDGVGLNPTADPVVLPGLNPRLPSPGNADSGSTVPGGTPTKPATSAPPPTASTPTPPTAPAAPAGSALKPGARVGLELASLPGHRVRHVNFQARVEPVNAASSTGTKADAAFVVRSGLTGSGCVSFESVNFPGHFLRHYEFRVFLHRADGSALFRADATFCPVTGIGGRHTSLRSYNYPSRYLSHDPHRQMRISAIGDGASSSTATFVVRPAL